MMTVPIAATEAEKRRNRRIFYSRYIFFTTRRQFFEGELKDYSKYGLFIKSPILLPVGETITVALPYSETEKEKRRGTVVWCNVEGFGVELFRDREPRLVRKDFLTG
ncbi:MAG: PilZ domain-containing protein [Desulfobacterales bacterium]